MPLALPGEPLNIYDLLNFYLAIGHLLPLEFFPALLNEKRLVQGERGSHYLCPRMKICKTLRKGASRETQMLQIHFKRCFQGTRLGRVPIKYM